MKLLASDYLTLDLVVDCNFPECVRPVSALGLCSNHYMRAYRYNKANNVEMPSRQMSLKFVPSDSKVCTVCGASSRAKGFCPTHYNQWWRLERKNLVVKPVAQVDVDDLWAFVKKELNK
jgi:hypothetical protein